VETSTYHATHNAVKAEELSVFIGSRCLLSNTELKISEQAHGVQANGAGGIGSTHRGLCYGLVGVNGCGKSTLLKFIAEGSLPVPANWDAFLVNQHLPAARQHCAVEEVLSASTDRARLLCEQQSLENELAEASIGESQSVHEANSRLVDLHNELSRWDDSEKDITQILLALGFRGSNQVSSSTSEPSIATPMAELSGGWRMKVQLAKALWLEPKLLLLDEPTNHLDFQALTWLQERLEQYPHTSVVVSHDVSFLHQVCQEIVWMRDMKLESLPRDAVSQEDLLRMQRRRGLNFKFSTPQCSDASNHGLSLHGVEFSYGGSSSSHYRLQVKKEVRFSGTSRSVLLGKNGSGKSTFLDLCVGRVKPDRGTIDRTQDLKIGHYSQLTEELDRNSVDTAASFLVRECPEELALRAGSTRTTRLQSALAGEEKSGDAHSSVSKKAAAQHKRLLEIARGVLSHFGFEGDVAVTVPVDRLSGGQKALLKFAVLSLRPAHILLLDEPTNHLDAEACEALARGLSEFEGGIVAVTHDELLIYRLIHCNWSTSELLICREGKVWRERNFGAHCLNALKSEVHKAEDVEMLNSAVKQSQQKLAEPPESKCKAGAHSTGKELPPWLQTKRRSKEKKDQADVSMSTTVCSGEIVQDHLEPTQEDGSKQELLTPACAKPYTNTIRSCKAAVVVSKLSNPEPVQNASQNALDSWEEAANSDASTADPDSIEENARLDDAESVAEWNEADDASSCFKNCSEGSRCEVANCADVMPQLQHCKMIVKDKGSKDGRHSRFRKDLVNLNKAVIKWLRQETQGEMTESQVADRIRNSSVAQQLRALHEQEFDEDLFVQNALGHARQKTLAPR
jgi:ATPase subunit of ABC transporter with duplicated ATPase domains